MAEIVDEQADLLSKVQSYIATKACKKWRYSRVGREIQFLIDDIVTLRNFEFVLCGKADFTCEELECLKCVILRLKN